MTAIDDLRTRWRRQRAANVDRAAAITAISTSDRFRAGLHELADRLGRDSAEVEVAASRYLDEMVTVQSDALPDFNIVLSRLADRRGFEGVVQYDERAVERLWACNEVSPLAMMTGHRSYLDFVLRVPFARRGFPREFRFAGANNLFWPIGPFGHNAGIIFIRRGFRDPVYTFALRQYVGWLTERRANFLWALEGGRSRTGKLLPPKAGLLAYVAEAYTDGRTADVMLVPATVVYEYLNEVYEYARYGRGASKSGESLLFTFRLARQQRRVPPEAKIYLGIGEPVSLAAFVDRTAGHTGDAFVGLRRCARRSKCADASKRRLRSPVWRSSCWRCSSGTTSSCGSTSSSRHSARYSLTSCRRELPAPEPGLGDPVSVRRALSLLTTQGLVEANGSGDDATYRVRPGMHLEAAYYRNAIVHFFAIQAIVELALTMTAARDDGDTAAQFWRSVGDLRELLGGEFFFPEGVAFDQAVVEELRSQARLVGGDPRLGRGSHGSVRSPAAALHRTACTGPVSGGTQDRGRRVATARVAAGHRRQTLPARLPCPGRARPRARPPSPAGRCLAEHARAGAESRRRSGARPGAGG